MQLFLELLQCAEDEFPRRVTLLERLHRTWKYDHLVPATRNSSETDSDDAPFGRDVALGSPSCFIVPTFCRISCNLTLPVLRT